MLAYSIDVTEEANTTAAGDTYRGAPCSGTWRASLIDAERWATGAAALAARTAGAQASIPTLADAEATFGTPVPR